MKKWIIGLIVIAAITVIVVIIIVINSLGGLQAAQGLLELQEPELRSVSLEWGEVTLPTTEILGTINIYNPNSVTLPIESISCDINIDDIKVGRMETLDLQIKEEAEFPIKIVAYIDNSKIPEFWAEHLKRNEISEVAIELDIAFNLAGVRFTIPYTIRQPLETNILAYLNKVEPVTIGKKVNVPILGEKTIFKISMNSISGKWLAVSPQNTQIELVVNVYNDNIYPLIIPQTRCQIQSNGMALGSGDTGFIDAVLPKTSRDIKIDATIDSSLMDEWFVQHIRNGEHSNFDFKLFMVFELPEEILTLIGQEELSIDLWEGSHHIETDILGNR